MRKSKRKVTKIISSIILVIAITALLGFLAFGVKNIADMDIINRIENIIKPNENVSEVFYIEYAEQEISGQIENVKFAVNTDEIIDLEHFIVNNDYSIKIVPNKRVNDFDFIANNEYYSFHAIADLTECFDIEYFDTYFTINSQYNMDLILGHIYPNDVEFENLQDIDYFTMIITSGTRQVLINFGLSFAVRGVELNQDTLIVGGIDD